MTMIDATLRCTKFFTSLFLKKETALEVYQVSNIVTIRDLLLLLLLLLLWWWWCWQRKRLRFCRLSLVLIFYL